MADLAGVEKVFSAALEKGAGADLSAFLDSACGQDVELRRRVEARRQLGELQAEPNLRASRQYQHSYNAACAAALAATGQGTDAPDSDDKKDDLRSSALANLQLELQIWSQLLESASASPAEQRRSVTETLKHWQADADLAGVRDSAELAKLPDAVRASWVELWAEVDQLLTKAARISVKASSE